MATKRKHKGLSEIIAANEKKKAGIFFSFI
jgi:hypothetical protein